MPFRVSSSVGKNFSNSGHRFRNEASGKEEKSKSEAEYRKVKSDESVYCI